MAGLVVSRRGRQGSAGQSLVEAAISLPILLLLTLGTTDIARAFYYREAVINAARQALRQSVASSQQATGDTACASGGTLTSPVPPSGGALAVIADGVALESTSNGGPSGSAISGATVRVTWHCAGATALTNAGAASTDPGSPSSAAVAVTVTYTMPLITPFVANLLGRSGLVLQADVVGRSEY